MEAGDSTASGVGAAGRVSRLGGVSRVGEAGGGWRVLKPGAGVIIACFGLECDGLSFDLSGQLWMLERGYRSGCPRKRFPIPVDGGAVTNTATRKCVYCGGTCCWGGNLG